MPKVLPSGTYDVWIWKDSEQDVIVYWRGFDM